ncbi:MAG: spoIIE [Clostridiales bacterium]|jgi:stage II sporulation protein E|nr:spoIIE [Bacillales bacterium]MDF2820388.1 spoIIE [Clostridiales bacterium]
MEQLEKINSNAKSTTKQTLKIWDGVLIKKILICIVACFLGRATIGSFNPIGIAYFAAVYRNKSTRIIAILASVVGVATKMPLLDATKYILIILMIICIVGVYEGKKKTASQGIICAIAGTCVLMLGIASAAVQMNTIVLYQLAVVEGLTVIALGLVFTKGTEYFVSEEKDRILSNEVVISIVLLGVSLIIGISDMVVFDYPIYEVVAYLMTLVFCYRYGIGLGAATGIITGFVLSSLGLLSTDTVIIMAISAVAASIFSEIGKIPCGIGYLMTTIIVSSYSLKLEIDYSMLRSLLTAEVIFITMPKSFISRISRKVNNEITSSGSLHNDKLEEITREKLKGFAGCFDRLGITFNSLAERRTSLSKTEVGQIFDELANTVCGDCSLCNACWKNEFYETYKAAYSILGSAEKNGRVRQMDIPNDFKNKCVKLDEFIVATNSYFDLFKNNLVWNNKMAEGRELIAEQLQAVAKVIDKFANQLSSDLEGNRFLEKRIEKELKRRQINFDEVLIIERYSKRKEIYITLNINKVNKQYSDEILDILTIVLDKHIQLDQEITNITSPDTVTLRYSEIKQFRTVYGMARESKEGNNCSGDNYSFLELDSGQTVMALSDGMGSGAKACKESEAAIELLEQFLETGFDRETAIKMINSVLVLKSTEQSFSTLDLSIIDLYSGTCEIIKVGASSTFIKKGKTVEVVRSTNLPIGVMNDIELDEVSVDLDENDLVIMVTDGVLDAEKNFNKEHFIKNILEDNMQKSPQGIADAILSIAKQKSGNDLQDDMTVLVVRICKN